MRFRVSLLVTAVFSVCFALGLWAAPSRVATLPPYDPAADVGKIPAIGSTGYIRWTDASAVTGSTLFALAATGSVTNNDLVAFAGTGGRQLKDSGIPLANVVLVSRAVQAGTGLTVTNSGLLSADITMSLSSATGATGPLATITPQTTKGDLIGFSTLPIRVAVGTTGATLVADSTATAGVSWLATSYLLLGPTGAQTMSTGTNTPVNWAVTTSDPSGNITLSNNTRINVAAAGNYLFTGQMEWASNSTGLRSIWIDLNGAGSPTGNHQCMSFISPNAGGDITSINYSCIIRFTAAGYAELFSNQTSGGNLSTRTDAFGPRMNVQRLSP